MAKDSQALVSQGVTLHQRGDYSGAEICYRSALAEHPDDWNVVYLLATCFLQVGRFDESRELFAQVVAACPKSPDALNNLGLACQALGDIAAARDAFETALMYYPKFDQALFNLGRLLESQAAWEDAERCYCRAIKVKPADANLLLRLLHVLTQQRKWEIAETIGRLILQIEPQSLDAHVTLAFVLAKQSRLNESIEHYQAVLRIQPDFAEIHASLGTLYEKLGRIEDAVASAKLAVTFHPDYAEGYNTLGTALCAAGRFDEAIAAFDRALALQPAFPLAEFNRGTTYLISGRFTEGWPGYARRFEVDGLRSVPVLTREWNGEPLPHATLLIRYEQGLGDTLQFIRYAAWAKQRAGHVIVEAPALLADLVATVPGVDAVIVAGQSLPEFAAEIYLLDLPRVLGTTLETIPCQVPYVSPSADRVAFWREQMQPLAGCRVGICWQGNPQFPYDRLRSIPLVAFDALFDVEGVSWISLQQGPGRSQLAGHPQRSRIQELPGAPDGKLPTMAETAAVMRNLDLVITSDTSVAHLAGALGVPTWLALSRYPEWRWLWDRETSPWYPSMRIFRQTTHGDWNDVFARIAEELKRKL
ncbi:MAG: tetratricopeptide repeat protein [Planctomycetaceae bacterium]